MGNPPRFVADAMLGRLARWLRILGYDTRYFRRIDDAPLVQIALAEGRWLLTRDRHLLAERRPPLCLLIRSVELDEQVRQVVEEMRLRPGPGFLMRCLECNEGLLTLPRGEAKNRIPPYVFATQVRFYQCPACQRVYWPGTHDRRMRTRLREILPPGDKTGCDAFD